MGIFTYRSPKEHDISNKTYLETRALLGKEYKNTWRMAGVRVNEQGRLYISNSFLDGFRFGLWNRNQTHKAKFRNACEALKEKINAEFEGWDPEQGVKLGDYVFQNLNKDHGGVNALNKLRGVTRLDDYALERIDTLILEGMQKAAARTNRINEFEEAKVLFTAQSDDTHNDGIGKHAAQWRNILAGNRIMRAALTQDLIAAGLERKEAETRAASLCTLKRGAGLNGLSEVSIGVLKNRVARPGHSGNGINIDTPNLDALEAQCRNKTEVSEVVNALRAKDKHMIRLLRVAPNWEAQSLLEIAEKNRRLCDDIEKQFTVGDFSDEAARRMLCDRLRKSFFDSLELSGRAIRYGHNAPKTVQAILIALEQQRKLTRKLGDLLAWPEGNARSYWPVGVQFEDIILYSDGAFDMKPAWTDQALSDFPQSENIMRQDDASLYQLTQNFQFALRDTMRNHESLLQHGGLDAFNDFRRQFPRTITAYRALRSRCKENVVNMGKSDQALPGESDAQKAAKATLKELKVYGQWMSAMEKAVADVSRTIMYNAAVFTYENDE